jgi:hypothetical protein
MNLLDQRESRIASFSDAIPHKSEFVREITLAVLVKLALLFGVWGLFFAGQKHVVDQRLMAAKLLGDTPAILQSAPKREMMQ